jgi:histidyl-tRNA synthetase
MGGPATPATGWAGGVERLAMLLAVAPEPPRPIAVIPIGEACEGIALRLSEDLRRSGLVVDLGFAGNLNKRMKRANKLNARVAVLLGEDELAANVATLRDLDTGVQEKVALDQLAEHLAQFS